VPRERRPRAVQAVVEPFRQRIEVLAALDHVPADVDAELARQRDEPREDLRDAAADGGRVHVLDVPAAEAIAEHAELVDRRLADERGIGVEVGHRCGTSPSSTCRSPSRV
jgi:hypothetical protein